MPSVKIEDDTDAPPPSDALIQLLAPDGYYAYLGIEKPSSTASGTADSAEHAALLSGGAAALPAIDEEQVKKNYRRLSLKHHPDKPTGDADTFRALNRAKHVLLHAKARQQYDTLGIDLDDEEKEDDHGDNDEDENGNEKPSTAQGIVHEMAQACLTGVLQFAVRTVMMGAVSVVLVRYRWTLYPTLALLTFVAYQLSQQYLRSGSRDDLWLLSSPLLITAGLLCMHRAAAPQPFAWSFWYWFGETLVLYMFVHNSTSSMTSFSPGARTTLRLVLAVVSMLATLWFRGNVWNYAIVIGFEVFMLVFIALSFPVMEMILDAILNEKLKRVGDKVRHHHEIMEAYYKQKLKQ